MIKNVFENWNTILNRIVEYKFWVLVIPTFNMIADSLYNYLIYFDFSIILCSFIIYI